MAGLLSQENRRTFSRGLLDATQAASNSAASTVSAPVDALAWALRKAGIPIPQAPFGGSDWMKAQGLMRDVQSPVANAVGETIGGVLPIVAAAKAPQIAAGLLTMGENAMARTPMNTASRNQAGAIVWHGSPHKFDRFDASKIGTGEGAQAYGHGLYLAESPEIAGWYQKQLGKYYDEMQTPTGTMPIEAALAKFHPDGAAAAKVATRFRKKLDVDSFNNLVDDLWVPEIRAELEKSAWSAFKPTAGNLYKVDLPDDQIAKMLDWDKPLSQQAPEVRSGLEAASESPMLRHLSRSVFDDGDTRGLLDRLSRAWRRDYGKGGEPEVVDVLRQQGIPGIRYLDGGSRGAGSGTSNFVVFPGNEGLLNILERNGQPIR